MMDQVINTYFSNIPMVLCTDGTFVAAGNPAACARLKHLSEGESLFEYMSSFDALCFETAFDCVSQEVSVFSLKGYHGFRYAVAVFQKLMGRRFAAVYLFQNKKDCDIFQRYYKGQAAEGKPSQNRISAFVSAITGIDAGRIREPEDEGLFDIKTVTVRTLKDMTADCDFLDCEINFVQNKEAESRTCIPSAIGVGNYIKLLMCMIFVLNDLTTSRKIEVKLCSYGDAFEIRMATYTEKFPIGVSNLDGLSSSLPGCSTRLTLCRYIAGYCGGELQARTMHDDTCQFTLSLTLSADIPDDVDLKSRDQFVGYQRLFDRALQWMRKIS